jgi:MerR family transcriptional regulator, mercuric resistance operon regulatory protein
VLVSSLTPYLRTDRMIRAMEKAMGHETLRTGEVAARAGVNVETLRYYERRGILAKPGRRPSGYREYPPDAVRLIRFIKKAQGLGFTLDEVQELLRLRSDGAASCSDVRAAAAAKIAHIDAKIRSLSAMRSALDALVASCNRSRSTRECPILEALEHDDGGRSGGGS